MPFCSIEHSRRISCWESPPQHPMSLFVQLHSLISKNYSVTFPVVGTRHWALEVMHCRVGSVSALRWLGPYSENLTSSYLMNQLQLSMHQVSKGSSQICAGSFGMKPSS